MLSGCVGVECMILISPELLYVLRNCRFVLQRGVSDSRKVVYSMSLCGIPDYLSWGRLVRNFRSLEMLGILRILYLGSRTIEIEISKDVVDLACQLKDLFVDEHKFEFNTLGLKCLFILSTCPYDRDLEAISSLLGVSERGVRNCLMKLKYFRFIDDKLNLTDIGSRVMDVFIGSPLTRDLSLALVVNPFLRLSLTPTRISLEDLVDGVLDIIRGIIRFNEKKGFHFSDILLMSISDKRSVLSFVDRISELLDMPVSVMPIAFSKVRMYDVIVRGSIAETKILNIFYGMSHDDISSLVDIVPDEIKYMARIISSVADENTLTILFAPYVVTRGINHILSKIGEKIIFPSGIPNKLIAFFRLDEDIKFLVNDMMDIQRLRDLRMIFENAFRNAQEITIRWNEDTDYPSHITIKIKRKIDDINDIFTLEDGSFETGNLIIAPLGELRIHNIYKLARRRIIAISGEINILGEPIVGLKRPNKKWVFEKLDKPEHVLSITDTGIDCKIRVKKSKYNYFKFVLDGKAFIDSIHFGGNSTKYGYHKEYHNPLILSRTRHFIHMLLVAPTLIDQNILTTYHLLINDARVLVDDEVVWKTY